MSDTRQKVVDLVTGEEVAIGEIGELLVSGPQVMQGYFGRADATAESIVEDDTGRWLRTGDIVTVDDEGYVTIHDRAKEMIKYKGYQIAPAELESLIIEHPDVADAAVIPKDTGTADGEIPKAFVVLREGATLSAEEVMEHVAGKVAPYKKLREVEFVDVDPEDRERQDPAPRAEGGRAQTSTRNGRYVARSSISHAWSSACHAERRTQYRTVHGALCRLFSSGSPFQWRSSRPRNASRSSSMSEPL